MPFKRVAQYLSAIIVASCFGTAQTSTSSLSGLVTDASGAAIPGANVTVSNVATASAHRQRATGYGLYSFPALAVGLYTIEVAAPGFRTARRERNTLTVGTPLFVDIRLAVGDMAEVVTVESTPEQLQTGSAALGNVVSQKAIVDLPLNGRNPLTLLVLEPGVVQRGNGVGTGTHVNGSRDMSSNVTIDGIDANESSTPGATKNVYRLNPDNVQEYRITTNNANAEEGRNSGASVSVATRSGTNQFHGTVFEFFRNTALNANEFFANALGNPKPDIKLNQYGFEIGGPIVRNRTFFFASWQGQRVNISQPIDQVFGSPPDLYTPSARAGIYRYFIPDPASPFILDGQRITQNTPLLVNASTGALRPEVRSCGGPADLNCVASFNFASADPRGLGVDPKVKSLLDRLPQPNSYVTGDGLNTAAYLWNSPYRLRGPSYMFRADHKINENHSVFARWLQGETNALGGDPNNGRPQIFPGFPPLGEVFRTSKNLAVSHRSVVSPRIVNELTLGFSRFGFLFTKGEANPDFLDLPAYARNNGTGVADGFNNVDTGLLNNPRTYRVVTTPQILDNLTIVSGSHIVKTGFNFRFYRHNDQRGEPGASNVTPVLNFSRTLRPPVGFPAPAVATPGRAGISSVDSNRLQGTINDVLGIPARLRQTFLGDLTNDVFLPFRTAEGVTLWSQGNRMKQYNFFVQDEWKARRNVTVNWGLRWEINPAPSEAAGRVYVPDRAMDGSQGLVAFVKKNRWYQRTNWGAAGPRIGVTWSPGSQHKTVIRSGYAMAFDTISSFQVTAVAGSVPGLTYTCSATVGQSPTPGCASVPDIRVAEGFPNNLLPPAVKPSSFLTPPRQLLTNAPSVTVFDQALKVPTVHQWNLSVQHELRGSLVAQVAYVGRRGTRLFRAYDLNQINSDSILPSFLAMQQNVRQGCSAIGANCPGGINGAPVPLLTQGVVDAPFLTSALTNTELSQNGAGSFAGRIEQTTLAANLRPNQQFGTITYIDNGGDSSYHSLQATLRKRFASGLLFGAAYTFGKSIDNQSVDPVLASSNGGLSTTNARTPTDIRNFRLERGRSDFDRTHVFTGTWIYELPIGRGKRTGASLHPAWQAVVSGWSVNGIFTAMTGEPFSVRSGVRTANNSHESRAEIAGDAPQVRLVDALNVAGPVFFPDASAFRIPAPGANGAGRNIFVSPSYWNLDLSVVKSFNLGERLKVQLRTEMFNALNHANFENPRDATVSSTSFISPQFGSTCCQTVAPESTKNIIETGESARAIQLALKLTF